MAQSLPLLNTLRLTGNLVWKNRAAIAWLVVAAAVVKSTATWLAFKLLDPLEAAGLYKILSLLVYTLLAVNVHRVLLRAENPVLSRWTMRETRFLGWLLVIYVYFALIFALFGLVIGSVTEDPLDFIDGGWTAVLAFLLLGLPGAYLGARLSMLLPATAVDKRQGFAWSWALTDGNGLRLVALLWVLPFVYPMLIPNWVADNAVLYLAASLVHSAGTALEVALLSAAFSTLGGLTFNGASQEQTQHS
ncbi:MAG: hypothetical protein ACLGG6_03385 [Gammaproteobacteria bacterium]